MEGHALATSYQKKRGEEQGDEVQDTLEACVQEEARKMRVAALEEEVTGFLEMLRYSVADSFAATGMVTIRHGR
jgi:hypothetical protein